LGCQTYADEIGNREIESRLVAAHEYIRLRHDRKVAHDTSQL
jgi:hypothetical protein